MKSLVTLALLTLSICVNAQADIMQMIYDVNGQPERVTGYSKMETMIYGQSYEESDPVDTTIVDIDGNDVTLTLKTKSILIFGKESDVKYDINILSGDTSMITITNYNKFGKIASQSKDYGSGSAAMFNSNNVFTYDDLGRVISVNNSSRGNVSGGTFEYNSDGLPQSMSMNMGMAKFNVTREDMDDHIKFSLKGEMSPEMIQMMEQMGKSIDDMPQEFLELREKDGLFEIKHMKEEGDEENSLTLEAFTLRDKEGNIHEQIKYSDNEAFEHKKYTFIDGKITNIFDPLAETNYTIEYDSLGNPLSQYDAYSKSIMTYNKDGMLVAKTSGNLFNKKIGDLEVFKYYK